MLSCTLKFDKKNKMFLGEFKEVPKEFIRLLKEQRYLEKVTDEFIESLPDTFDGEVNIDPFANTEKSFWIFFYIYYIWIYMDVKAPEMMKAPIQEYLNSDIDINEDDDTMEFNIIIPKTSEIVKKSNKKEIIIEF